jgi:type VI secretion system protein ImpJ
MDFITSTYWHQGLFLQPQHFQRLELNQDFQRKPLFDMRTPHFWGIGQLELAPECLLKRSFEIRFARLIFQDRTYIELPGNATCSARSFDKIWTDGDRPLDVYLGMKKLSVVAPNVTVVTSLNEAQSVSTRMISSSQIEMMPDLYAQGPEAAVPTALYALKIFFGPEIDTLDDYDLIPIAQLVRDSDAIRLVSAKVPPCFTLSGSTYLVDILRDIRDDLAGRLRQVSEYKIPRNLQRQDLDPDYLSLLQSIQVLNRLVPTIYHLTETELIHPWTVYGFLRVCVGELSTFSDRVDVQGRQSSKDEGLPTYDHLNLGRCFTVARQLINQLLSEITVGPKFLVFLEPEGNYLVGKLPSEFFADRNRFYLVTKTSANGDKLSQEFLLNTRLAAKTDLPTKLDHALPGIELIEILNPPQGLPQRAYTRYYRIEQQSDDWDAVERAGEIAMFWPDAPEDLRVEIVVLRG